MKYSVITINFNNSKGLLSTIKSVIGQTSHDFEYIVIDGGSDDGSLEIIKEYADKIDYWVSESDRGIYHAMNKGVAKAHGDYCIFMNSGDVFYDDTVLERVEKADACEDVIVGKAVIDDKNNIISPPPASGELTLYHLYSGAIPHQGSFIKTESLRKYPYDETLKISSDWKFFIQTLILDNGSIRYIDEFVARYDMTGVSSRHLFLMRQEKDQVLTTLLPPRVLADYRHMKESECLVQTLTPLLRRNYGIDRLLYWLGSILLRIRKK